MIKIGITGGIGSGKSVVSSLLKARDIPVYIADLESKILTDTSTVIRSALTELFGNDIYSGCNLNRQALASFIFNDKEMLQKVNAIIHPEVRNHFLYWASGLQTNICGIESAILFEAGFDHDVDVTIMVYAPLELRIKRVVVRDGLNETSIISRINNQMPDEEKKLHADFVIYNDEKHAVIPQLDAILKRLS